MASPQPDKFIRYSRELFLAKMRVRISGVQNQVWEAIIFLTYGQMPQTKMTVYSNKKIQELTGLSAVSVSKAKQDLFDMNMVFITKNGNESKELIGINKDYDKWNLLPKKVTLPILVTNVTNIGNGPESTPIKRTRKNLFVEHSNEVRLASYLFNHIRRNNQNAKEPSLQKWAAEFDKIIRLDKRPVDEIKSIISWCQSDPFWKTVVLSPGKLREKYDQLYLKLKASKGQSSKTSYSMPVCPNCKTEADNIKTGERCPYCDHLVE